MAAATVVQKAAESETSYNTSYAKKCTFVRKKTRKPTQILLQYRYLRLVYEHRIRERCILAVGSSTIIPVVCSTTKQIERW